MYLLNVFYLRRIFIILILAIIFTIINFSMQWHLFALCKIKKACYKTFDMYLKLAFTIFYQIFIFSPNDSPLKTMKCFLFYLKTSFHSWDIQIFVIFSLPFHTFQIQKDKWKWNNLWCHELACINLQM